MTEKKSKYASLLRDKRKSLDYWAEVPLADFTEELARKLSDGLSQAELARRVETSAGYISRVMQGGENLSIRTMTKLALAAGCKVRIHLAGLDCATVWKDVYTNTSVNFGNVSIAGQNTSEVLVSLSADDTPRTLRVASR